MAKIYNIHSNTISEKDLEEITKALDSNKDLFILNEDIRYEVIDFDKMTVMKSSNYTKNIYAFYIKCKFIIKSLIKVIKLVKKVKNIKFKR